MKKKSRPVVIISDPRFCDYMEDRHSINLNFVQKKWIFGGVYDAHGAEGPAVTAKKLIPEIFRGLVQNLSPEDSFCLTYEKVSLKICAEYIYAGTCAANFFVKNGRIFYANVGDARIVVIGSQLKQLTTDHRVSDVQERARIFRHHGETVHHQGHQYVSNGERLLMPSRTLGDKTFKHIGVIHQPTVGSYVIMPSDRFLLAATDGLFDEVDNEEVFELAHKLTNPAVLAEGLRQRVAVKAGHDNLTILILKL